MNYLITVKLKKTNGIIAESVMTESDTADIVRRSFKGIETKEESSYDLQKEESSYDLQTVQFMNKVKAGKNMSIINHISNRILSVQETNRILS